MNCLFCSFFVGSFIDLQFTVHINVHALYNQLDTLTCPHLLFCTPSPLQVSWSYETTFSSARPVFCHFGNQAYAANDAPYALVQDNTRLPKLLSDYLESYNMSNRNVMNLVFFQDAIDHVSRLCRVLRTPSGNAMLVGLGGSGKQSLSRLSAFIVGLQCHEVEAAKSYSMVEFREDLKKLYMAAGVDNIASVFLFNDSQITDESFLEDLSCILNTGEVPNLFTMEEQEQLCSDMKHTTSCAPSSHLPASHHAIFKVRFWSEIHFNFKDFQKTWRLGLVMTCESGTLWGFICRGASTICRESLYYGP